MRNHSMIRCATLITLAFTLTACSTTMSGSDSVSSDSSADAGYVTAPVDKSSVSDLALPPLPSGTNGVERPAGTTCNLAILDWAGFKSAATYTFDDGQPSQIQNWPALKATNVPMTFYLEHSTGSSDDEVWKEALAAGCELGNHSASHKRLAEYSGQSSLTKDIADCTTYLEGTLGETSARSFAYPFGETGWKAAFGGKFLFARSVNSGTIKPYDSTDPLGLPVFSVAEGQTKADFNAALDKSADEGSWVIFLFHTILPGANWYAAVETSDVTASIGHAKNGGRIWIDTVETIGAYWLAQKNIAPIFSAATGSASAKHWAWTLPTGYPTGKYLRVTVSGGTLSQNGKALEWNPRGFYEVSLDALSLDWAQ